MKQMIAPSASRMKLIRFQWCSLSHGRTSGSRATRPHRPPDRPGDLAGNRRDDHLRGLDQDEDDRRHPAPRSDGLLEELLVLVEANEGLVDRGIHADEPDDDGE